MSTRKFATFFLVILLSLATPMAAFAQGGTCVEGTRSAGGIFICRGGNWNLDPKYLPSPAQTPTPKPTLAPWPAPVPIRRDVVKQNEAEIRWFRLPRAGERLTVVPMLGTATTLAALDGPLPVGDAVAVVFVAGVGVCLARPYVANLQSRIAEVWGQSGLRAWVVARWQIFNAISHFPQAWASRRTDVSLFLDVAHVLEGERGDHRVRLLQSVRGMQPGGDCWGRNANGRDKAVLILFRGVGEGVMFLYNITNPSRSTVLQGTKIPKDFSRSSGDCGEEPMQYLQKMIHEIFDVMRITPS